MHFSEIDPVDAVVASAGNRFDVPGGGVLYLASHPQGAYAETLARFRPTPAMKRLLHDEHSMLPGSVPAEWRMNRTLLEATVVDPLPFLDVDAPATHTYLNDAMANTLDSLGVESLDVAVVRGRSRLVTRAISAFAYVATDEEGRPRYSGLRYGSKLGSYECWAVFSGTEVREQQRRVIASDDGALVEVAHDFGLTIH